MKSIFLQLEAWKRHHLEMKAAGALRILSQAKGGQSMKTELHRIPIRELVEGYVDDADSGVRGYGGRLDTRSAYQREFVYRMKERNAVKSEHRFPSYTH